MTGHRSSAAPSISSTVIPGDGRLVIADYKTDRVESEAEIADGSSATGPSSRPTPGRLKRRWPRISSPHRTLVSRGRSDRSTLIVRSILIGLPGPPVFWSAFGGPASSLWGRASRLPVSLAAERIAYPRDSGTHRHAVSVRGCRSFSSSPAFRSAFGGPALSLWGRASRLPVSLAAERIAYPRDSGTHRHAVSVRGCRSFSSSPAFRTAFGGPASSLWGRASRLPVSLAAERIAYPRDSGTHRHAVSVRGCRSFSSSPAFRTAFGGPASPLGSWGRCVPRRCPSVSQRNASRIREPDTL